jgi:hypothetical protein
MTSTDRERITLLETELAELKSRLPPEKKPAPIVEDEGVRVTYSRRAPIELPTRDECEKLIAIVFRTYPQLDPEFTREWDRRQYVDGFTSALWRIAYWGRVEKLQRASDLAIEASTYVRTTRPGDAVGDVSGAFLVAAIAAGDVKFSVGNSALGAPWKVGLGYHGEPARPAWKEILQRGSLRAPEPTAHDPRPVPQPHIRHYGG